MLVTNASTQLFQGSCLFMVSEHTTATRPPQVHDITFTGHWHLAMHTNQHSHSRTLRAASPVALADELGWLTGIAGLQLTSRHHNGADAQLLERQGALEGLTCARQGRRRCEGRANQMG